MKTTQKGFVVPLVIGIIAVLAVGGGAYVYNQKNKSTTSPTESSGVSTSTLESIPSSTPAPVSASENSNYAPKNVSQDIQKVYTEAQQYQKGLNKDQLFAMSNKAVDRKVENIDTSSYVYTKAMGYQFKTPWGEGIESEKTKKSPTLKQIEFSNGKKLLLICGTTTPRYEFIHGDPISNDPYPKEDVDQMLRVLGNKADSGFDFVNFYLSTSVDDIKYSKTLDEALGISKLLTLKSTQKYTRPAYRINLVNIKGFQFGVPSSNSSLNIKIFPNDGSQCEMMANESNKITQSDLDVIWSTFSIVTK
jgi:hypothetical protein